MNSFKIISLCLTAYLMSAGNAFAFEHEESKVNFLEYGPKVIQNHRQPKKPFFLLFAAQWCHWCHVFNDKTLTNEKVISFPSLYDVP